jgi:hypothetical protein
VQAVTGHSDLKTVMGYIHSAGRSLAVAKMPELPAALMGGATVDVLAVPAPSLMLPAPAPVVQVTPWDPPPSSAPPPKVSLDELAAQWLRAGSPAPRPKEVTAMVRRAYSRAYTRSKYAGEGATEAKAAGQRAKRATLGAWGKALEKMRRAGGGSDASP